MNKLILLTFILNSVLVQAQVLTPNSWSFELSNPVYKVGDEIDLVFKAKIDKGWHLYSSDFDPELGPMVTEIVFEPHASYALVGALKAINPKKDYDEIFKGNYTYFEGTGEFRQTIKI